MSIKLMTAVWERDDLSSTQKLVLLALADWANDEGLCWPSIARICSKASLKQRAVQMAIRSLEDAGFIRRDEVMGKGNKYWLTIPPHEMHPCTTFTPPLHEMHPTPALNAPNTSINHQLPINVDNAPSDDDAPVSPDEVLEYWNTLAGRHGLPKISKLTPARKQRLASRIKEFPEIESWATAFKNIEQSAFLRGDNDRGWKANFDFLLQPGSFVKLIEGVYNGK